MVHYEKFLKVRPDAGLPASRLRAIANRIVRPDHFYAWADDNLTEMKVSMSVPEELEEARWNYYVMARYVAEGERVFRVEPGLARLLLDTDLPKINGEELRVSFPAIFLEFPGKLFTIPIIDVVCIGCYIVDARAFTDAIVIDYVVEPQKGVTAGLMDFALNMSIPVKVGVPVVYGDLYEKFMGELEGPPNQKKEDFARRSEVFAVETTNFVINSLLYATSASPELTEVVSEWRPPKAKKSRKKGKARPMFGPKAIPQTRKMLMGPSIRVEYGAPRATDQTKEAKEHRKILKRFRVRGHWKQQVHGKGEQLRQLRKRIFITPFWKGPKDMAELLRRKYGLS